MTLNIFIDKNYEKIESFKDFFVDEFFVKDNNLVSGILFDIKFYTLENIQKKYKKEEFNIFIVDTTCIKLLKDNLSLQEQIKEELFVVMNRNYGLLNVFDINNAIMAFNFLENNNFFERLFTEIAIYLLRKITSQDKLKIFISHAKKDGLDIAYMIKNFIQNNTKLDTFFDEYDIQISSNWQTEIEKEASKNMFLFVYSDSYSQREWTNKEVLIAKKYQIPIVGIDVLSNEDSRMFPYLGNIKMIKLKGSVSNTELLCDKHIMLNYEFDIREVINALLKEALKYNLFEYKIKDNLTYLLLHKPELFDLTYFSHKKKVIYPDPPIPIYEIELLTQLKNIKFYTPLTLQNYNFDNLKISLAMSESNDTNLTQKQFKIMLIEIFRYLLSNKATLVYGGSFKYSGFNFIEILAEFVKEYNSNYTTHKKIINYTFEEANIEYEEVVEFCKLDKNELSYLRDKLTENSNLRIAIGGKITGFQGYFPGVYEEIIKSIQTHQPIFLIGMFGGITKKTIDLIEGKKVKELTYKYQKANHSHIDKKAKKQYNEFYKLLDNKGYKILNNKLSKKENEILFYSTDINEIIKILLKGIEKIKV